MKKMFLLLLVAGLAVSCKTKGWSAADRTTFVSSCAGAAKGAMGDAKANSYCDCMQKKLEAKYPDPKKANELKQSEFESEAWMKEIKDCLK